MKKILIIGSAHVDFVSHVNKLPQGNEEFNVIKQEDGSQSGAHHHFFLIGWRGEERDIVTNRAGKEDIILHDNAHAVARGNHVFHAAFPLIQINLA